MRYGKLLNVGQGVMLVDSVNSVLMAIYYVLLLVFIEEGELKDIFEVVYSSIH